MSFTEQRTKTPVQDAKHLDCTITTPLAHGWPAFHRRQHSVTTMVGAGSNGGDGKHVQWLYLAFTEFGFLQMLEEISLN